MNRIYTTVIAVFIGLTSLPAQQFVELACGANYGQQAYYRFSDDGITKLANNSWDIALTTSGLQDAGVLINESTASSFTAPVPALEAYRAPVEFFTDPVDPASLVDIRFNTEESWNYGALNTDRDPANPFDYGWGTYQPTTNRVVGDKVFVLKLRDETYRKLSIDSLVGTTWYLRWADLDGSNLQTLTVNKNDHSDAGFAYISIQNGGTILNDAPQNWDLFWGRYSTPLDDGAGDTIAYNVTGVLSGPGIEVAEADGVDIFDLDFYGGNYQDSLSTDLEAIGYDWKAFDFSAGWVIDQDRAFWVKTRDQHIWQMIIIDFEGSSTGNMVFEKTDLGVLSSLTPPPAISGDLQVGPNPLPNGQPLLLSAAGVSGRSEVRLVSSLGQTVWQRSLDLQDGLQELGTLPRDLSGTYYLQIQRNGAVWSTPLIVQP